MICEVLGCNNGPFTTGDALYRVNPKGDGEGFVGRCEEHLDGPPEADVKAVVDAVSGNH